jgi:carboxypeptidase family protein
MSRSRYAVPALLLCLVAGSACDYNILGDGDWCTHSEGCDSNGGGWFDFDLRLTFNGVVTSAATGEAIVGVTVRIEAPARGWTETVLTGSTGYYVTNGLPDPKAGDCVELSVSFTREGFEPLRISDFPQLTCARGFTWVNVSLIPTP